MHLVPGFALNAADACVPYRTSCIYAERYDAEHVAAVLDADFRAHGAPLVLRDDCASCHTAPAVLSLLDAHGVALLQGPPYYAQYYGQHERQNREHRDWLAWIERTTDDMQAELDRMKTAVNERWMRPTVAVEAGPLADLIDEVILDGIGRRVDQLVDHSVPVEQARRTRLDGRPEVLLAPPSRVQAAREHLVQMLHEGWQVAAAVEDDGMVVIALGDRD